jgi:hypothetical protein
MDNCASNHLYIHVLSTQAAHHSFIWHPDCGPWYWPRALSPGQISEVGVHMTLAPGMSEDGKLGDNIRTFREDQICASGSLPRPGRVSERRGGKKHTHLLTLI